MVTRPEDKPKIIALIVAICALFGYFAVVVLPRLMHGSAPSPPESTAAQPGSSQTASAPASAGTTPPASPGTSAGTAQVPAPAAMPAELQDTQGPMSPMARNPFLPPAGSSDVRLPIATASTQGSPAPQSSGADNARRGYNLPTIQPGPGLGTRPMAPRSGPALPEIGGIAREDALQLKGVVRGRPAVAVFKLGDSILSVEPHDILPNGLKVASISGEGVILQRGKELYAQEVGGPMRPVVRAAPGRPRPGPAPSLAERPDAAPYSAASLPRTVRGGTYDVMRAGTSDGTGSAGQAAPSSATAEAAAPRTPDVSRPTADRPATPAPQPDTPSPYRQYQGTLDRPVQVTTEVRRHKVARRHGARRRLHRYIIRHGRRLYYCWRHHRYHRWPVAVPRLRA